MVQVLNNSNKLENDLVFSFSVGSVEVGGSRLVVPGGAGGAPPDFGRPVNPISTKGGGADYVNQIIMAHPDFQTFRRHCAG